MTYKKAHHAPLVHQTNGMLLALATLYGTRGNFADFFDNHLSDLTQSSNETARRAGELLAEVKVGFSTGQDVGRRTAVSLIAIGQLILGGTLSPPASGAVAMAAPTAINVVGMTCGAIGAVYYGWSALTDEEKEDIFNKVRAGLEIGIELLRSVVRFTLDRAKSLFSTKNLEDIKEFLTKAAVAFGSSLGEITGKLSDRVADSFGAAVTNSADLIRAVSERSTDGLEMVKSTVQPVIDEIGTSLSTAYRTAAKKMQKTVGKPSNKD